jgi:hypothetical protein
MEIPAPTQSAGIESNSLDSSSADVGTNDIDKSNDRKLHAIRECS